MTRTAIWFERHISGLPLLLEGANEVTVDGNVAPVDHLCCNFV